ncbi:DUF2809 domain-containing protein [Streptomyces sp. NPDC051940]|uniref:ribosomal maturation YjgA family protein n=1 Tax=Streptomyces sp. NPDC051940 TaxID=3155675 RepID=UPI00342C62EA
MTDVPRTDGRLRLLAAAAGLFTVCAGLGSRATLDGAAGKVAGDVFYTVFVCAVLTAAAPRLRPSLAAAGGLAFSCAVELLQLTGVPSTLAGHSVLARLALGTTFNAPDLLWYGVGAAVWWAGHSLLVRRVRRGSGRPLSHPAEHV